MTVLIPSKQGNDSNHHKVLTPVFQTGKQACPFCRTETPRISVVHNEFVWNCCDDLPVFVEENDPNDEKNLLKAAYSKEAALADWIACAAFAAAKINMKEAA